MALAPGTRLGPYEITAQIGEGGLGEVSRATDTNLKRSVAIKVLPASVAGDSERLARFQREAEVLAALNHPHIAQIHGLEKSDGTIALVMELVEGPTLADMIAGSRLSALGSGQNPRASESQEPKAQGHALPLDEALPIAKQIAEALEAAHEQGIIHRDLKPANIKVRADGMVKVLDFGLAKAMDPGLGAGDPRLAHGSQAPTITTPAMTQMGMILGTAAYMAPEQASGKPVDKRADIWAFGVVLWETLTGRRMFEGETVSHVLAAVLTKEPDLTAVPARVRHLLTRCLEKDSRKRLRDIGDAMSLVQDPATSAPGTGTVAAGVARSRARLATGGWAVAGALAAALVVAAWLRPATVVDADPPVVRYQIERVADVYNNASTTFAVSPDGQMLVYYGVGGEGQQALLLRELATGEVRELPGSATATPQVASLFWSADSRQLAFGTVSSTSIFDVSAGATRALCECRFVGGSWNRDGVILLGASGNRREGIRRLSVDDRNPVAVTSVDASRGESDTWPVFLPDGRRFLFTRSTPGGESTTYLGTIDGGMPTRVADGSQRIFVPAANGRGPYLLGIDATGLTAQAFDIDTLNVTGTSTTLVPGAVAASASENGVLATSAPGSRRRAIPTWFDRKGASLGTVGDEGLIESIALSLDGRKMAIADFSGGPRGQTSDIWLRDLASGANTRVTFNPDNDSTPVWSPDGTRIAFSSRHEGVMLPYQRVADGTGAEVPLFPYDRHAWVNDWSRDGRWVIYSTVEPDRAYNDLWSVPMSGATAGTPLPYLAAPGRQQQAQFSPDGRFVAYGSDQSGTFEIYVQPFPKASDGKWMVSSGGGAEPRWSRDGRELFFFSGQTLMAVPVNVQPTFSHGAARALFDAPVLADYSNDSDRWQVAPDGQRFLLLTSSRQDQAPPLDVIVNWPALLQK